MATPLFQPWLILKTLSLNNKFVTPAKAAIQFSKELTKAGVNQTLTANEFQFVLKDSAGHIVETVGNTADGRVALVNFTLIRQELTLILLKKLRELTKISSMMV